MLCCAVRVKDIFIPGSFFMEFQWNSIYTDKYLKLCSPLGKKQPPTAQVVRAIISKPSCILFSVSLSEKWREFTVLIPDNGLR